jgi:outer membrane protein TolC
MMVVLVSLFFSFSAEAAVTLKEAYDSAVAKTENVLIAESRLNQSKETAWQSYGTMFPTIAVYGSFLNQHPKTDAADSVSSNFLLRQQFNSRVGLTQPLFRGFGEYAGIRSAQATRRSAEASVRQSKVTLYANVSAAYFKVLGASKDVENLKSLISLTRQRVKDLQARARIGRSREGEVLAAESQVAVLVAQFQAAVSIHERAKDVFAMTTGLDRNAELAPPPEGKAGPLPALAPLQTYMHEVSKRPDLIALQESHLAADENVAVARAGHYPSLDFSANYYLARAGIQASIDFDLGLTFVIPIFQGGIVNSATDGAIGARKERELLLAQGRRIAENEVRDAYERVKSGLEQVASFELAATLAEKNYRRQTQDYRLGLVTNLDVLQALNTFQETKRGLDQLRFNTLAAWDALQASLGKTL